MNKKTFEKPACRIFPIGQDRVIATSPYVPRQDNVYTEEYEVVSTTETDAWFH